MNSSKLTLAEVILMQLNNCLIRDDLFQLTTTLLIMDSFQFTLTYLFID